MTLTTSRDLRSVDLWQRLASGNGMSVLLAGLVLLSVAWPIQRARWVNGMAPVTLIALVALALLVVTDHLAWRGAKAHLSAAGIGLLVVLLSVLAVAPGSYPIGRFESAVDDLGAWFLALSTEDLVPGRIEFVIFITALMWALGYWGAWFVLKRRQAWVLILPLGLVLVMALANLASGVSFWLVAFMALALGLQIHVSTMRRQDTWRRRDMDFEPVLALSHSGFILGFGFAVILLASVMPSMPWLPLDPLGRRVEEVSASFGEQFGRLFNGLPSRRSYITLTYGEETFFRGNPNLTDQVIFRVSGRANYWRARTYAEYTGEGWTTGDAVFEAAGNVDELTRGDAARVIAQNDFYIDSATDSLFTAGLPRDFNAPALYLRDPDTPWEVLQVRYGQGLDHFKTRLNLSYTSRGAISTADEDDLRGLGGLIPPWVSDTYLQLPVTLPTRVIRLVEELVADLDDDYDKAIAIREFLLDYQYNLAIAPPPTGADGVDHFLFNSLEGYCDYYASSMAVMLRIAGIPSRYVLGYAAGTFDAGRGEYIVRDLNYHSWPEAYFPGFGWIAFEPTPPDAIEFGGGSAPELPDPEDITGDAPNEFFDEEEFADVPFDLGEPEGPGVPPIVPLGAGLGALIVGLLGLLWYRVWWRLTRLDRPAELYGKMQRLGTLLGFAPRPHQTPREYGWSLAQQMPGHAWAVLDITEAYTSNRYGHHLVNIAQRQNAEVAWGKLRWAMVWRLIRPSGR